MSLINVDQAITNLKAGAVVGVPTETVYGLAGLISDEGALHKIFATKERPFFDPLIVHVLDLESARLLTTEFSPVHEALAEKFWPGPLTIVAPRKLSVDPLITSGLPTVALRSPSHPMAREILKATGPFAAPSANRFGKTSPTTANHVVDEFAGRVDVVDGGPSQIGLESTVVEVIGEKLLILRPGRILKSDLEKVVAPFGLTVEIQESKNSPGHLKHHYQPEVPLVMVEHELPETDLRKRIEHELRTTNFVLQNLDLPVEPSVAARILYSELRRLSQNKRHVIVASPHKWGWKSDSLDLMDRLSRASTVFI
jgi:L-threonylcarbamoyladenylate synthase